jgi:hypothetical protein
MDHIGNQVVVDLIALGVAAVLASGRNRISDLLARRSKASSERTILGLSLRQDLLREYITNRDKRYDDALFYVGQAIIWGVIAIMVLVLGEAISIVNLLSPDRPGISSLRSIFSLEAAVISVGMIVISMVSFLTLQEAVTKIGWCLRPKTELDRIARRINSLRSRISRYDSSGGT